MVSFDLGKVSKSEFLKEELARMKAFGDAFIEGPMPPAPSLSSMKVFAKSGGRREFEDVYFKRRGILASLAVLSMAYGDKKYLDSLEDIIWAICEETSWSVTAHYSIERPTEEYRRFIDLFAAETGFALAEIYFNLQDKLSDIIKRRMVFEVRERIIESFLGEKVYFRWEKDMKNNWAAVCTGGVFGAFMVFATKEETDRALPRFMATIDNYLAGFEEDGACTEGCGYWTYGFGYFTCFADLLKEYTNNEVDLFDSEKVKNIALFQQKVYLTGNNIVSFSDAAQENRHIPGLTHFVYNRFGGVEVPDEKYAAHFGEDHCYRFAHILRNFSWYDHTIPNTGIKPAACYSLPDSGWYINRRSPFSLAAKGGHNDEPHNHNDVGSFVLYKDGQNILCDLGAGAYTRQYFRHETRYGILCNGSQGHSVPIINGEYQKTGKEYSGDILSYDDSHFCVDIKNAYGIECLQSLKRTITVSDDRIELADTYDFREDPKEVIERFISYEEPKMEGNTLFIQNAKLTFEGSEAEISVTKESHKTHRHGEISVYLIDYKISSLSKKFEIKFRIE